MDAVDIAKESLDAMLGYLGFVVTIEEDPEGDGAALQVLSEESEQLIGRRGERLEDIQYLINRIVQHRLPDAPRIRVDIAYYRRMHDDRMLQKVRQLAERVRASGKPAKTAPLNAYHRRLVHNLFKDDGEIDTWSPPDGGRIKRIKLYKRQR